MTLDERAMKTATQLFELSKVELPNAKTPAISCMADYFISNREPNAADILMLKFRDMPIHSPAASFIFSELERKVLCRQQTTHESPALLRDE
jgi:hypothetical protein